MSEAEELQALHEEIRLLKEALRPLAESIIVDPTKKPGDFRWLQSGEPTAFEDQLRAHRIIFGEQNASEIERERLARTKHLMSRGAFVPLDDEAMITALQLAEENDGSLLSCERILPLALTVRTDFHPYPNAREPVVAALLVRAEIACNHEIDDEYWAHCRSRWADKFPKAMENIARSVEKETV